MHPRHWWKVMFLVLATGFAGVMVIGVGTYRHAPPIPEFVDEAGAPVVAVASILRGQVDFQRLALMEYGSMFGDGAMRGPDFTADALHTIALLAMAHEGGTPEAAESAMRRDLRRNTYDAASNRVTLPPAVVAAIPEYRRHVAELLGGAGSESVTPAGLVGDSAVLDGLADFFFWGGWVCVAERPGTNHSYTHNWPYDPLAGNHPSSAVSLWSVIGALGFMLGLGWVLYMYGRYSEVASIDATGEVRPLASTSILASFRASASQRMAYPFFALAAIVMVLQVVAGILTVHDFVGVVNYFGWQADAALPITIVRSWHVQLSLFWIASCWIGASLFVLPLMSGYEPRGQALLARVLFVALATLVAGSIVGIYMGPMGMLGEWWRWFGHQGWEFVEFGRVWQIALFVGFVLWAVIVMRGTAPLIRGRDWWSLQSWLLYSVVAISALYLSSFVAAPTTNFVIADFWRWCVIHMWVEAFFEVFTTVIVAYMMYLMGLVSLQAGSRVVFLATVLFLGSGILGISHNFYWNAKPVAAVALGSVFSTLQVVPLLLLALEAWRYRRLPERSGSSGSGVGSFALGDAFLFLLAVNFWNFLGAGVFGFIINLPIVNYFEHGTYLTVNHGHAALMGVYGNLAIAAVLFCSRFLVEPARWNERLIRVSFWSLNIGLMLMVLLDLLPAGIYQLADALEHGLWHARSQALIDSDFFQTVTWLRAIGGAIFVVGGVCPIAWFVITRAWRLRAGASA